MAETVTVLLVPRLHSPYSNNRKDNRTHDEKAVLLPRHAAAKAAIMREISATEQEARIALAATVSVLNATT